MAAACEVPDKLYTVGDLPPELRASKWEAPCAVDLSQGTPLRRAPKFDTGDEVEVTLTSGLGPSDSTRITTTVGPDGTIELPTLGRIPVTAGFQESVRQAIVQVSATSASPDVEISLKQARQNRITVTGAVQHPGVYTLPRQTSDLVSALAAAGGLSRDAGTRLVIQSRAPVHGDDASGNHLSAQSGTADFEPAMPGQSGRSARREIQLAAGAATLRNVELADGDVLTVERQDPPSIVVTGLVQHPGRFELPIGNEYRILDAIAAAQGVSYKVLDTVLICRQVPGENKRAIIQVSLRAAVRNQNDNILLAPGDVVDVEASPRVLAQDVVDFIGNVLLGAAPLVIH